MLSSSAAKMFNDYCRKHGISTEEGIRGALDLLLLGAGDRPARRAWFSVLEVRQFRPEALAGIFNIGPDGVPSLLAQAAAVEHAHAMWKFMRRHQRP
jgi:hypothetical protein